MIYKCKECGNDILLEEGREYVVGDIVECPTCGTVYEVVSIDSDGVIEMQIVEEEK